MMRPDENGTDDAFDAEFGDRLRRHLHAELEPHIGSATVLFDALRAEAVRTGARTRSRLRIGLRWSAAAMLLLSVGVAIPLISSQLRKAGSTSPAVAINDDAHVPTDAVVTSWAETYDAGTVFVDPETPARMLRRVQYEKTAWKDAAGRWQSTVKPQRQDVILVDLQKQ